MPEDLREQIESDSSDYKAMGLPLIMESGRGGRCYRDPCKAGRGCLETISYFDWRQRYGAAGFRARHISEYNDRHHNGCKRRWLISLSVGTNNRLPGFNGRCCRQYLRSAEGGPQDCGREWLNQYDTLEAVMENAEEIGGKGGENLRASLNQLPLSKRPQLSVMWSLKTAYLSLRLKILIRRSWCRYSRS